MNQSLDQLSGQLRVQRQRLQREQVELESAREELSSSEESWKIIGNLMVKKNAQELQQELDKELEEVTTRLEAIKQQEQRLQEASQE